MTFDLGAIFASKRTRRRTLATRPIADKLRMLDALRERELAIRRRTGPADSAREPVPPDRPPRGDP